MLAGADIDLHGTRRIGTLKIVSHRERGGELVAWRGERGHIGRDDQRPARQALGFRRAHRLIRQRDRHDLETPVKVIRHRVSDLAALRICRHQTAPEHHGRVLAAFERIELHVQFIAVATAGFLCQLGELRQNQVQQLVCLRFQRPLAVEVLQRLRKLVIGDLMNAFVHGKDDHPAGLGGGIANFEHVARLHFLRGIKLDGQPVAVRIGRERLHGVAERADEDLG